MRRPARAGRREFARSELQSPDDGPFEEASHADVALLFSDRSSGPDGKSDPGQLATEDVGPQKIADGRGFVSHSVHLAHCLTKAPRVWLLPAEAERNDTPRSNRQGDLHCAPLALLGLDDHVGKNANSEEQLALGCRSNTRDDINANVVGATADESIIKIQDTVADPQTLQPTPVDIGRRLDDHIRPKPLKQTKAQPTDDLFHGAQGLLGLAQLYIVISREQLEYTKEIF